MDGWTHTGDENRSDGDHVAIFEKNIEARMTLRKLCHASTNHPEGKGCYWDEHEFVVDGHVTSLPDWEWAEVDRDRLVWAESGRLFAAHPTQSAIENPRELCDFSNMTFAKIKAPY